MSTATATPTAFATHDEVHEVMWTFKPAIMATMKKPLLALLAVVAVAVVAVVIFENMPERRLDRRYDRLLRLYDDPEKLFQRVVDDRDLLGFALVESFLLYKGFDRCSCGARTASEFYEMFFDHKGDCGYTTYRTQQGELSHDFWAQFEPALCDCGAASSGVLLHPADCSFGRALGDIDKTWGPYIRRKTNEFREAWLNR